MRDDGDASKDDGEDEDTHTGDKGLPLPGHAVSVRGILTLTGAKKKLSAPCEGCEGLVAVVCHDGGLRPRPDPCQRI